MQTTNELNNIHVKVALNNEFRRFSLEKANYNQLVDLIRTLFSLSAEASLKICFVDDEEDKVLISSDHELLYAAELVQPLKLVVTVTIPLVPLASVELDTPAETAIPRCRGRGCMREDFKERCEERRKWKEQKQYLSKEERIAVKIARISARIEKIEALLLTDLPARRQRILSWKLDKLQGKLECLQLLTDVPTEIIPTVIPSEPEVHGRMGRRGRGCGNHGGNFEHRRALESGCGRYHRMKHDNSLWKCRHDLRSARACGDQNEIEKCYKALQEAKIHNRDQCKRGEGNEDFWEQKQFKRTCMQNLREARASGDPDKIKECVNALIEARESWRRAKVQRRC